MASSKYTPSAAPRHTRASRKWLPIRSLSRRHRPQMAKHLLALSAQDRYLRFGYAASDAQIERYVETLDFDRDQLFGVFNRRLDLIAMVHLAYPPAPRIPTQPAMAEFGVSVLAHVRGRGYGAQLFAHAALHARNRGMQTLFVHALTENTAMLKIARQAGASVERDGSETEAWLRLPPLTLATQMGELMETQAAELDYRLKAQALRVHTFFDSWANVYARRDNG